MRQMAVVFKAFTFGEPDNVEPVLTPPFTIVRTSQKSVDELLVGIRGRVIDECLNVCRRGRQAGEIERDSADQSAAVCLSGGMKSLLVKLCQNKRVKWIEYPVARGVVAKLRARGSGAR